MGIRRRGLLKSTAGVVLGIGIGSQSVGASQSGLDRSIRAEQAKYLHKHAARRRSIYDMMIPIFDPPDNEDYAAKFAESLAPSASSLLPGIAGSAADLKETLEWYSDILESNKFRAVSQQGILIFGEDARGRNGHGMDSAKEELVELKHAASTVEEAASNYRQTPTEENRETLIGVLQEEHHRTENIDWIDGWSNIWPSEYESIYVGDAEEAAEQIRDNADVASQIISANSEVTQTQAEILGRGGLSRVPDLITTYSDQIDQVRQNVPGSAFSVYAGDSLNIRIQNEDGDDITVTWINTNSNGEIAGYELVEQSANADLMIPEATVERIRDSENPSTEISKAWDNDEISLEGNGFIDGMKYNHTGLIAGFFEALSDL